MNSNDWAVAAGLAAFAGAVAGGVLAPNLSRIAAGIGAATTAGVFVALASIFWIRYRRVPTDPDTTIGEPRLNYPDSESISDVEVFIEHQTADSRDAMTARLRTGDRVVVYGEDGVKQWEIRLYSRDRGAS